LAIPSLAHPSCTTRTTHALDTSLGHDSPVSSVAPQMPPDAHGPGLVKVTSAWQNQAPLRLLLSLMATPQYPPLRRLSHSLPHSPLLHHSHCSCPQYLTRPRLTSIVGSTSNASRCAQTWTHQGHFSTAEPSPIEAPVIPYGHASISTPAKTVTPATAPSAIPPLTHPSCSTHTPLSLLSLTSHL